MRISGLTLSINGRILLAASLVLAAFLGLTGWALDKAFRESAEAALKERLQAHLAALIAASDLSDEGALQMPAALPEARFSTPGSGLYAQVHTPENGIVWRSHSAVGLEIPFDTHLGKGVSQFSRVLTSVGTPLYAYNFGLAWDVPGGEKAFTFSVAETLDGYYAQVNSFRRSLSGWLIGVSVLLLAVQGAILRWGLAPLRRVADDLSAIEAGRATQLQGPYPRELRGLTSNLNGLIRTERAHLDRYRRSLGDLAHSLKTPLAVLHGVVDKVDSVPPELREALDEQLGRMRQIVEYQLQRAATSGRTTLAARVRLDEAVRRITRSLDKVYADKGVICTVDISPDLTFHGDEDDLLEMLGNVLDNAYKWCRQRVEVKGVPLPEADAEGKRVSVRIADDGPGIPDDKLTLVRQRGVRADETTAGHGIGLAMVQEIIQAYGGRLDMGRSALGGAQVTVTL